MAKEKRVRVKFLKPHHRYAYDAGQEGLITVGQLKGVRLVEDGFVEVVKSETAAQKQARLKAEAEAAKKAEA